MNHSQDQDRLHDRTDPEPPTDPIENLSQTLDRLVNRNIAVMALLVALTAVLAAVIIIFDI